MFHSLPDGWVARPHPVPTPGAGSCASRRTTRVRRRRRLADPTGATGFPITVNAPPPINVTATASPSDRKPGRGHALHILRRTGSGYTFSGRARWAALQHCRASRSASTAGPAVTTPYYCTVHDSGGGRHNNVNVTVNRARSPLNVNASASPIRRSGRPGHAVLSASGGTSTGYAYSWSGLVGGSFSNQPNFTFTASNNTSSPVTTPYYCTVTDSCRRRPGDCPLTVYGTGALPGPRAMPSTTLKDYLAAVIVPVGSGQFSLQISVGQVIQFRRRPVLLDVQLSFGDGGPSALPTPQYAFRPAGTRTSRSRRRAEMRSFRPRTRSS